MNNEDQCSNWPPASEESTTGLSEMVVDEINSRTNDEDAAVANAQTENIFVSTTSVDDAEKSIGIGDCQPSEVAETLIEYHVPLFDNQPVELERHLAEPADEIPHASNPIDFHMVQDFDLPLSPQIQDVTVHGNIPPSGVFPLYDHETRGEPIENENDDIQLLQTETIAIQTIEGRFAHEPIQNENDRFPVQPIIVIDLTHDDEIPALQQPVAVSPPVIDLTQDDEEVSPIPMVPHAEHIQNSQAENDPTLVLVHVVGGLPLVTASSSEATDQNPTIAVVTDNSHEPIETSANLQVPVLPSRTNKRPNSLDGNHHTEKKRIAGSTKRCRKSFS